MPDHLGPADVADHALTSGPFERPDRDSVALGAQLVAASRRCRDMASVADYQTALREVRARAEALGLGYAGARPRALFDVLKSSLPALARPVDAFRRPGQRHAQRRVLAQCEELMVTVAAALHTRDVADEERAVEEARRLCRLLVEVGPALDLPR